MVDSLAKVPYNTHIHKQTHKGRKMTTKQAMFVFIVGLLITFGAVGGIEVSVSNTDLMSSMVIAILGLLTMYCGMLGIKGADYYDR